MEVNGINRLTTQNFHCFIVSKFWNDCDKDSFNSKVLPDLVEKCLYSLRRRLGDLGFFLYPSRTHPYDVLFHRFQPSVTWPYDRKLRCLQCGADTVTTAQVESVISDFSAGNFIM